MFLGAIREERPRTIFHQNQFMFIVTVLWAYTLENISLRKSHITWEEKNIIDS